MAVTSLDHLDLFAAFGLPRRNDHLHHRAGLPLWDPLAFRLCHRGSGHWLLFMGLHCEPFPGKLFMISLLLLLHFRSSQTRPNWTLQFAFLFFFRFWAYRSSEMETIGNSNLDSQHLTILCQPKINLIKTINHPKRFKKACQIINLKNPVFFSFVQTLLF